MKGIIEKAVFAGIDVVYSQQSQESRCNQVMIKKHYRMRNAAKKTKRR